jgi:hypothetical protein
MKAFLQIPIEITDKERAITTGKTGDIIIIDHIEQEVSSVAADKPQIKVLNAAGEVIGLVSYVSIQFGRVALHGISLDDLRT